MKILRCVTLEDIDNICQDTKDAIFEITMDQVINSDGINPWITKEDVDSLHEMGFIKYTDHDNLVELFKTIDIILVAQ